MRDKDWDNKNDNIFTSFIMSIRYYYFFKQYINKQILYSKKRCLLFIIPFHLKKKKKKKNRMNINNICPMKDDKLYIVSRDITE